MSTPGDNGRRFPPVVYRHGGEPDARFTLANERTFLAWIRTSLALIAGGVALEVLGLDLQPELRLAASLVLLSPASSSPRSPGSIGRAPNAPCAAHSPCPVHCSARCSAPRSRLPGVLVVLAILLR